MQVKINEDKENKLLKRRELTATVDYEGKSTPSRNKLELAIATMKKVDFNRVQAHKLFSDHGRAFGKAWIRIYDKPIQSKIDAAKAKKEAPAKEKTKEVGKPSTEKPKEEKAKKSSDTAASEASKKEEPKPAEKPKKE